MIDLLMKNKVYVTILIILCIIPMIFIWYIFNYFDKQASVLNYLNYRSVEPTKDSFEITEELSFFSDRAVYENISVIWEDILRCDLYDWLWYRYYSYYESKAELEPSDKVWTWVWQWEKPSKKSKCYLDINIKVITTRGNIKNINLKSSEFIIK